MSISRRHVLASGCLSGLGVAMYPAAKAMAQPGPSALARIYIGFPPGGTTDAVSRHIANKLQPDYARSVIVESKVGASGQVAIQALKTAPNDGNSMVMTPMSILGVFPHTYKKLSYDPFKDVKAVSRGVSYNYGFAVGPAVPASVTTVPQFMEWCKQNPDKASFGSGSTGSTLHFVGVLLGKASGVSLTHVGYRGSSQMLTDVAGGNIPACSSPIGDLLAYEASGRLRVLGTSGQQRSRFLPKVPTFVESGYKDMAFTEWYGFYLPPGATAAQVQRLNQSIVHALADPSVVESLSLLGMEATPSTPQALEALLKSDHARWEALVKSVGFTVDS
jgi:tripartite-type tricarboxylate transporter receptor subunit TctC